MCGIAGILDPSGRLGAEGLRARATEMAAALMHRGPDDGGIWVDEGAGIALGHRRLSIVDLSEHGRQPMADARGRWHVVYNGEIYNHGELRAELARLGEVFRGSSDTEVLVAALSRWGPHRTLERLVGMFAFAAWDGAERTLHLARDRFGEKPLYYAELGSLFAFASELKALRRLPEVDSRLDSAAVGDLLARGYIASPRSIFRSVRKLAPATLLTIRDGRRVDERSYWDLAEVARRGQAARFRGTLDDAVGELDALLRRTVRDQMIADVPLGAFLSSGVDSPAVVSIMQAVAPHPVRTFTIGVRDPAMDEAPGARAIAAHLGTEHTELYVTPDDALAVVPRIASIYDEPLADYSQIPTLLVAELTKPHVGVSLSADGGDETFGGYNTYRWSMRAWRVIGWMPRTARRVLARGASRLAVLAPLITDLSAKSDAMHRPLSALKLLESTDPVDLFERLGQHWWPEHGVLSKGAGAPERPRSSAPEGLGPMRAMQLSDSLSYLPDDVLTKVDRAAMSVSLETRAPLLDHRVVEFAWTLPDSFLFADGTGKRILRRLLARYVPPRLTSTQKRGFTLPMAEWLRGPLRDWAEELLSPSSLASSGLFEVAVVRKTWNEHVRGVRDWKYLIWDVLSFQSFFRAQSSS